MANSEKYLQEWFVRYTKNRDIVFRKISNIKEEANKVIIEQKDGRIVHYYIAPFPEEIEKLAESIPEEHKGIVMYNSKDNFDKVIKAWKRLSSVKDMTIYFVNPFSKLDKRWIINPSVHGKISDPHSLETGLNSMYIMVDPISKEEVEQLTK